MSNPAATIHVTFQVEGLHHWPGAIGRRAYLAHPHRHQFHVEVSADVEHDDREVEFHDLKDLARALFDTYGVHGDFGPQSCEMLARRLATDLAAAHDRDMTAMVSEDGEFGATVLVAWEPNLARPPFPVS